MYQLEARNAHSTLGVLELYVSINSRNKTTNGINALNLKADAKAT